MALTDELIPVRVGRDRMAEAMVLSGQANWNQSEDDWAVFMEEGTTFGVTADNKLVGSAAILPFGPAFGWISMVLVTPEWRRRGIARKLMSQCIAALRDEGRAGLLDATPQGATVYRGLGFETLCRMNRWTGTMPAAAVPPSNATLDAVAARDLPVFGSDRRFLLANFASRPTARLYTAGDAVVVVRPGRKAQQIGPLIAGSVVDARKVLGAALAACNGPVIIDVLDAGEALAAVLRDHGFAITRDFERMALGCDVLPGLPAQLMVAAGPEFG